MVAVSVLNPSSLRSWNRDHEQSRAAKERYWRVYAARPRQKELAHHEGLMIRVRRGQATAHQQSASAIATTAAHWLLHSRLTESSLVHQEQCFRSCSTSVVHYVQLLGQPLRALIRGLCLQLRDLF